MEELVLHLDYRQKVPFAEQIENQLRLLIQQGQLRPNDQLPAVRQLAFQLKINFNTVARAYRALDMEGWITTQQGRGTYVLEQAAEIAAADEAALSGSEPAAGLGSQTAPLEGVDQTAQPDQLEAQSTQVKDQPVEPVAPGDLSTIALATKADTQTEWLERWLIEAEQLGLSLEQLRQAIETRLSQTQTSFETTSQPKKQPSFTRKRNLKPLYQKAELSERWALPGDIKHVRLSYKRKWGKRNRRLLPVTD